MAKIINAGIIGCNISEEFFKSSGTNKVESFFWKKIYLGNTSPSGLKSYPYVEVVEEADAIISDSSIDLVFVSPEHLHFVKPVIEAGKCVRVI